MPVQRLAVVTSGDSESRLVEEATLLAQFGALHGQRHVSWSRCCFTLPVKAAPDGGRDDRREHERGGQCPSDQRQSAKPDLGSANGQDSPKSCLAGLLPCLLQSAARRNRYVLDRSAVAGTGRRKRGCRHRSSQYRQEIS